MSHACTGSRSVPPLCVPSFHTPTYVTYAPTQPHTTQREHTNNQHRLIGLLFFVGELEHCDTTQREYTNHTCATLFCKRAQGRGKCRNGCLCGEECLQLAKHGAHFLFCRACLGLFENKRDHCADCTKTVCFCIDCKEVIDLK